MKTFAGLMGVLGPRPPGVAPLPIGGAALGADATADPLPEAFDARVAWPECASIQHIRDQGAHGGGGRHEWGGGHAAWGPTLWGRGPGERVRGINMRLEEGII